MLPLPLTATGHFAGASRLAFLTRRTLLLGIACFTLTGTTLFHHFSQSASSSDEPVASESSLSVEPTHDSYALPTTAFEKFLAFPSLRTPGRIGSKGHWLKDLGLGADEAFHLGPIADSRQNYIRGLEDFVEASMPRWMSSSLKQSLVSVMSTSSDSSSKPAMLDFHLIHQTDKVSTEESDVSIASWSRMNSEVLGQTWAVIFCDDSDAWTWVRSLRNGNEESGGRLDNTGIDAAAIGSRPSDEHVGVSEMEWAWTSMRRGVLKADYFRYLVIFFEGGVYSDIDTQPLTPITSWGTIDPNMYDISRTDGPDWRSKVEQGEPSVVVAVDVDVHMLNNWNEGWPRPLGFCQWTLAGAPHHPIHLDAIRRIVNATHHIEDYAKNIPQMMLELKEDKPMGWEWDINRLEKMAQDHVGILDVMEHTGPGMWTDAVLAYLKARYDVSWHELRGLARPLRIGDVLVLPSTAFSPGGQPDFHAGGRDDPQAALIHDFRGSWKSGGM